jgi:hypothetical protein
MEKTQETAEGTEKTQSSKAAETSMVVLDRPVVLDIMDGNSEEGETIPRDDGSAAAYRNVPAMVIGVVDIMGYHRRVLYGPVVASIQTLSS